VARVRSAASPTRWRWSAPTRNLTEVTIANPTAGWPEPDLVLRVLVSEVVYADDQNSMSVLLLTGGAIVSGRIVTPRRWCEELGSYLDRLGADPQNALRPVIDMLGAQFAFDWTAQGPRPRAGEISTVYLIDAVVAQTGHAGGFVGTALRRARPWIVQLSQVSAWALGAEDQ